MSSINVKSSFCECYYYSTARHSIKHYEKTQNYCRVTFIEIEFLIVHCIVKRVSISNEKSIVKFQTRYVMWISSRIHETWKGKGSLKSRSKYDRQHNNVIWYKKNVQYAHFDYPVRRCFSAKYWFILFNATVTQDCSNDRYFLKSISLHSWQIREDFYLYKIIIK